MKYIYLFIFMTFCYTVFGQNKIQVVKSEGKSFVVLSDNNEIIDTLKIIMSDGVSIHDYKIANNDKVQFILEMKNGAIYYYDMNRNINNIWRSNDDFSIAMNQIGETKKMFKITDQGVSYNQDDGENVLVDLDKIRKHVLSNR